MDTTVRIKSRSGSPTPWLEVDYPGLRPPLALFADLEMIGWKAPAIQPPPATAIDWSTPNAETGERFTVRDYPVTGAVVSPPPGSGRDGAWSEAETAAFTTVLEGVLNRHGVAPEGGIRATPAVVEPVAAPEPAKRRRFGRGDRGLAAAAPVASAAAPSPPPVSVGPVLPRSRKGEIGTVLEATVTPNQRADLEASVAALGFPYELRVVEIRTTESYRASTYETVKPAVQALVVVPASEEPRATAVLADLGLLDPDSVIVADAAPAAPEPELAAITPIVAAAPVVDASLAAIEILFDPDRRHAIDAVLGQIRMAPAVDEAATRIEVNSYRGTRYESEVPAVRMVFGVEPASAPQISALLAQAAGIDPSDPAQLSITLPPPPAPVDQVEEAPEGRPFRVISAV